MRSIFSKATILPALLILGFSGSVHAALSYDFNTAGQFSGNFSTSQTAGLIAQASTGGLGNSGHVNLGMIGAAQVWTLNTPFSGSLGSWSAEFYLKGTFFTQFGFTTSGSPNQVAGLLVNAGGTAYLPQIAMGTGNNDGGTIGLYNNTLVAASSATTIDLTDAWYRYKISVNYLGSGDFGVTATIHTSDSSGTLGSQIGLVQSTINNPELAAANQAHLFLAFNELGQSVDNFSTTIPEPSVMGLAALSVSSLFRRRR